MLYIIFIQEGVASDTLFSAKIVYYTFSPDYNAGTNYDIVAHYSDAQASTHDEDAVKWQESDLACLLFVCISFPPTKYSVHRTIGKLYWQW